MNEPSNVATASSNSNCDQSGWGFHCRFEGQIPNNQDISIRIGKQTYPVAHQGDGSAPPAIAMDGGGGTTDGGGGGSTGGGPKSGMTASPDIFE